MCNVPLNDGLAVPTADAAVWARYLTDWKFWNTVRTVAAIGAAGLNLAALTSRPW